MAKQYDVILSEVAKMKVANITEKMPMSEIAGPIFGHFDLVDGKKVLVVDDIFNRTTSSGVNHSTFAFDVATDIELQNRNNPDSRYIGTGHTHTPLSHTTDGIYIGANFSKTDKETMKEIHKEIGILRTVYLLITKEQTVYGIEGSE